MKGAYLEESIIEKVLQQVDIVDIVSHYVDLTKRGKNYIGVCPFHDDTHPSLSVNREKRIFNCFSCNTGGNAINFVQKIEKCGFKEAFNKIIDLAGLNDEFKMKITQENTYYPYNEKQRRQIKMNETIQEYLSYNIRTNNNEGSLEYLKNRGIDEETQNRFGIGYMHDAQIVAKFLEKKCGFTKEEISQNDLFRLNEFGIFSPYEHRITIPIYDKFNYLIGFAGRKSLFETKIDAKYINPSTTDIFQKSNVLFNLYNAKNSLHNVDEIYVVEGYLDVIAMDAAGYRNTVALMGTALAKEQIDQLKGLKKDIVIVLDGDKAGQKAMFKIYQQCVDLGLDVMFSVLPDGKDPDDMFKADKMQMINILNNYQYGYEFALDYYKSLDNVNFKKQKEQIRELMTKFVKQNRDELDKAHFFHLIHEIYHLDLSSIEKTYNECRSNSFSMEIRSRYDENRELKNKRVSPLQKGGRDDY